ncbi:MAG: hypothetical protein JWM05_285 [Acidimicrobiales bacterium]|nr:hypothetical protein [Acidimicrobiales bacterium]
MGLAGGLLAASLGSLLPSGPAAATPPVVDPFPCHYVFDIHTPPGERFPCRRDRGDGTFAVTQSALGVDVYGGQIFVKNDAVLWRNGVAWASHTRTAPDGSAEVVWKLNTQYGATDYFTSASDLAAYLRSQTVLGYSYVYPGTGSDAGDVIAGFRLPPEPDHGKK